MALDDTGLMGEGRVITCGRSLHDEAGRLLGVAALDLHFDHVIQHYLGSPETTDRGLPRFSEEWLLDGTGAIVAASHGEGADDGPLEDDAGRGVDLGRYPDDAVVAALSQGRAGYREELGPDGRRRLVAWAPLPHLGWGYAVHAEPGALFEVAPVR